MIDTWCTGAAPITAPRANRGITSAAKRSTLDRARSAGIPGQFVRKIMWLKPPAASSAMRSATVSGDPKRNDLRDMSS